MFEQRLPAVRVAAAHLEMLRRDAVADVAGFFHAAGVDQGTTIVERLGDDFSAGHVGQQAGHGRLHSVDVLRIRAEQDALSHLVMLGLTEEIHRHPVWRCGAIGEHQNFAWARDHVDAHRAENSALRGGYISVPRAGDFVNARYRRRAVRQCANRLRTANAKPARDPGYIGSRQQQGVGGTGVGHDHDDLAHARNMGGNGIHQQAGWIGCFAARHIDAGAINWRDFLSEQTAVFITVLPTLATHAFLPLVVTADAIYSTLQGLALLGRNRIKGALELSLRQLQ